MELLQRIQQAAREQGAMRTFSDVEELRKFVHGHSPARTTRVNVRMRFVAGEDEANGCRLSLISLIDDDEKFQAVCDGLQELDSGGNTASGAASKPSDPFVFRVLVWSASLDNFQFVKGDYVNLNNAYSLQDWMGRRLGATIRRADVVRGVRPPLEDTVAVRSPLRGEAVQADDAHILDGATRQ
jgi:hypothetical protein